MDFSFAKHFINLVLPPRCVVTGDEVDVQGMLSSEAWARLNFISEPSCACCGVPFSFDLDMSEIDQGESPALCANCLTYPPLFEKAKAPLLYDDASRFLILGFKHGDQTQAVRAFLPWLKKAGESLFPETDIVVPVPLHRWRLLRRRYNQSALISSALAKMMDLPHDAESLIRQKHTPVQGHLSKKERAKNVKGVFAIRSGAQNIFAGKNVLLIDDVLTTGSTVNECSKTLLKAGAKKIFVLTVARVAGKGQARRN